MECALWYWSHGSVGYVMHEDEESAANNAVYMADDGDHAFPAGVQRADGTYTPLEEWKAYDAEQDRLYDQAIEREREAALKPRPATRKVRPPFDGPEVVVLADAPAWLGRPS